MQLTAIVERDVSACHRVEFIATLASATVNDVGLHVVKETFHPSIAGGTPAVVHALFDTERRQSGPEGIGGILDLKKKA